MNSEAARLLLQGMGDDAGGSNFKSEAHLKKAVQDAIASPYFRDQNISTAYRELGAYYDSKGAYDKALECYEKNLPICLRNHQFAKSKKDLALKQGFAVNLGNAYHDIALTHKYKKDYAESEKSDLAYLNVMETCFGKSSKRVFPALQSLVHLYQESLNENSLRATLQRLQELYAKVKPDPNDEFFKQAISYTSSLPAAKGNAGRMPVQLDENYYRLLIVQEQIKQAYEASELDKAEKLATSALAEFKDPLAQSTCLEFLISIAVKQEQWDRVAEVLQQLISLNPDLSSAGRYNLEPHVALFQKFVTLAPVVQTQLKTVYAQLAGPSGQPSVNIDRLRTLAQLTTDEEELNKRALDKKSNAHENAMQMSQNLDMLLDMYRQKKTAGGEKVDFASLLAGLDLGGVGAGGGSKTAGGLNACGSCQKVEPSLGQFKCCARCKKTVYCTVECQKKAWKTHKKSCAPAE